MAKPSNRSIRGPQAGQRNGDFLNPPRYPEIGGLTSPSSLRGRTDMHIVPPGGSSRGGRLPPLPKGGQ